MQERYERVEPMLFDRLRGVSVGDLKLNLVQTIADENFPVLLNGGLLKERKNFYKRCKKVMDIQELAAYIVERADYEVETESAQAEAASSLIQFIDKVEKEIMEEFATLRERTLQKTLPNTLCSTFCNQLLDGELNSDESFRSALEKLCRNLESYKKTKIPKEYEILSLRINEKIEKIRAEISSIPKLVLSSIFNDGAENEPPNVSKEIFTSKATGSSLFNESRGIAITPNETFLTFGGKQLAEWSLKTGKKISENEFDVAGSATNSGFALNPFNENLAIYSFGKRIFLTNPDKIIQKSIETPNHPNNINVVEWIEAERLGVGYVDGTFSLFSASLEEDSKLINKLKPSTGSVSAMKFIKKGSSELVYSGDSQGNFYILNKDFSMLEWKIEKLHIGQINNILAPESNELIIITSNDKSISVMEPIQREIKFKINLSFSPIGAFIDPKLKYIVVGAYCDANKQNKLEVIRLKNLKKSEILLENKAALGKSVIFDKTGKFALVSYDGGFASMNELLLK